MRARARVSERRHRGLDNSANLLIIRVGFHIDARPLILAAEKKEETSSGASRTGEIKWQNPGAEAAEILTSLLKYE